MSSNQTMNKCRKSIEETFVGVEDSIYATTPHPDQSLFDIVEEAKCRVLDSLSEYEESTAQESKKVSTSKSLPKLILGNFTSTFRLFFSPNSDLEKDMSAFCWFLLLVITVPSLLIMAFSR